MAIIKLPKEVRSAVRNGITISTTAQCVTELLFNSLDAGADSVIVHLDVPHYKIQVVDNGCGITWESLKRVGIRYNTSKCQSLLDIQGNLKFYGYRGEALASLCESSGTVIILTRPRNEGPENSYCKTFSNGISHHPTKCNTGRICAGTTVTVQDFMYNAPVRKQRIKHNIDVEEIRIQVEALALSHPNVSFTIRDESDNSSVLNVTRSQTTLEAFSKLYGEEITSHLCPIGPLTSRKHRIHGFISTSSHYNKRLQFVFVNGKLVKGTKLHKLINMIMRKSDVLRGSGPWQELPLPERVRDFLWVSPMKKTDRYCVFLLNIDCPLSEYDITLDPKKTLVEFRDWDSLLECVESLVKDFLKRKNLACVASDPELFYSDEDSSSSVLNEVERLDEEDALGHKLGQFKLDAPKKIEIRTLTSRTICSMPAKRYTASRNLNYNSKSFNTSGINEKPCCKMDENELIINTSQAESVVCSKNNSVKVNIANGGGLVKCPSLRDKKTNATYSPFLDDPKRKNNNFDVNSPIDGCGSLGIFRDLFRQSESLSKKTPDIQLIRSLKPPPITKRNAPLEHRIKAIKNTEQFQNTGMNTITTCNVANTVHAQNEKFLKLSEVKDRGVDEKLSKINEETKYVPVALLEGSTCKYSGYFKKILPITSTATQTVLDSISFETESDIEGIVVLPKEVIKPNLKNINVRRENFKETLGLTNKPASQKCVSINKGSSNILNIQEISEYDCLNSSQKSDSGSSPKTQNESSMEKTDSGFLSSEDFLCDMGNQMEITCKNDAIKDFKNDVNLIQSKNVTVSIPEKLSHAIGNNLASDTILVQEPERSSVNCDKLTSMYDCEFSSVIIQQNDFNQSKVDTSINSECTQFPSKQQTPENISCPLVLNIPQVISQEEVHDHSSAVEQKEESLKKLDCQELPTDHKFNFNLATTVSTVSENYISTEAENNNETLIGNPSASNKITFKNHNCYKSIQKRLSTADDVSDIINKKRRMENLLLDSEKKNSMFKGDSSECRESVIHSLSHNSEGSKYSDDSASDVISSIIFQGTNDAKNNLSFFDKLNDWNMSQVGHSNKLENNSAIITNEFKSEISLGQNNSGKVAHEDNDNQHEGRFEMFARQYFMPKGLSPIMPKYSGKCIRIERNEDSQPSLTKNEFYLGQKPMSSDELTSVKFGQKTSSKESSSGTKSGNDNSEESFISCFLSETENKKYHTESEVLSACDGSQTKPFMKIYNLIYPCTFSKKVLTNFKMLGKLDDKFIVAQINMDRSMDSNVIVLFDQHAVHERIRLEKLMKEYQIMSKEGDNCVEKYTRYKSVTLKPPFEISLSSTEFRIMESFPNHFERLGLYFERSLGNEHRDDEIMVNIVGIPACLSSKDAKELGPLGLKEQVHTLIREEVENLVITRGLGTFTPGILRDAINMEACRGAVKFGDSLSYRQCCWLLKKLSTCDLPFQCAHGRPSMFPVLTLGHLENHCSKTEQEMKPHIWKIRKLME